MKSAYLLSLIFIVTAGQTFAFDDISTLLRQAGSEMKKAKSLMESAPLDSQEGSKEIEDIAKVFARTTAGQQRAIDNLELALAMLKNKEQKESERQETKPDNKSESPQKSADRGETDAKGRKPEPNKAERRNEEEGDDASGNLQELKERSLLGKGDPEDPADRWGEMKRSDGPALERRSQRKVPAQYRELIEEYYRRLGEYKE